MAAARKEAILSKVVSRLYPGECCSVTKTSELSEDGKEKHLVVAEESSHTPSAPVHKEQDSAPPKIYTVSLPPDNYVPDNQYCIPSSSTEEELNVEDDHSEKKRKRRRRRKKVDDNAQSNTDIKHNLQQENQPQKSDGVPLTKTKKRKLQRKRQKERLKSADQKTNAATNHLNEGEMGNETEEQSIEETQKEKKTTEDLLEFLQATQETYFTESKTRSTDSASSIELVLEIMDQIKNGVLPFSEISLLHHFKTLLFQPDIERLKESLCSFKEHSSLPLDHTMVLHSLFYYWITDILPVKEKATT